MSQPSSAIGARKSGAAPLRLEDGSRVAVVGGGPAGSFFGYFFLVTASRAGLDAHLDIYDPKNFDQAGPAACNMCGGIVSESLVQLLAMEGINLPSTVVQRGIDSYVLHMDVGSVRIEPPGHEKRIAAVHRGGGPRGSVGKRWSGFDGHLLGLAAAQGAKVIRERVEAIAWEDGKPRLTTKSGQSEPYDLLVAAVGVNGPGLKLFEGLGLGYTPPKTTKTFICEFLLGAETIETCLGSSMHVFLLNLPRLEFAALIPKGEYVTLVLLGKDVDKQLVEAFLSQPEVKGCFPKGWGVPQDYCRCFPSINVRGSAQPFADRLVVIGDSGESRLYKDGIGGAYRTAKAAANTAVFQGVSGKDFRRHYLPVCRALATDNQIGKFIFGVTGAIQALRFTRRGILRMVSKEQRGAGARQRMSGVLWDTFTGSAPYRDIFLRTLHPLFGGGFAYQIARGFFPQKPDSELKEAGVSMVELGKIYRAGENIIRQGEVGECMYVIQAGKVEVIRESEGKETWLAELGEGDFFGEMALFEQDVRSATVRAVGEVRVLTVDKKVLLRKIHEDPSLAFRVIQKMSRRIRELNEELAKAGLASGRR
jgi:flavin-dependent dehydrogenase